MARRRLHQAKDLAVEIDGLRQSVAADNGSELAAILRESRERLDEAPSDSPARGGVAAGLDAKAGKEGGGGGGEGGGGDDDDPREEVDAESAEDDEDEEKLLEQIELLQGKIDKRNRLIQEQDHMLRVLARDLEEAAIAQALEDMGKLSSPQAKTGNPPLKPSPPSGVKSPVAGQGRKAVVG